MKKIFVFLVCFLFSFNVYATGGVIQGSKDKDSNKVSFCNNKYYGYHKSHDVIHYHEVVWKDDKWNIVDGDATYDSNPCGVDKTRYLVSLNKCVDGDTAVFNLESSTIRSRFLAIDTPESVHPTKEVQAYGKNASEYTCYLLTNAKKIEIEYDSGSDRLDSYDRHLNWIWIDDVLLQSKLIEVGYARVYYLYGDYKYTTDLQEIEKVAKEAQLGIWGDSSIDYLDYYTVSFDVDGSITKVSVKSGEKVTPIEEPEKKDYSFEGWYLDDKVFDFNTIITGDIVLKAKFEKDTSLIYVLICLVLLGLTSLFGKKRKR